MSDAITAVVGDEEGEELVLLLDQPDVAFSRASYTPKTTSRMQSHLRPCCLLEEFSQNSVVSIWSALP